MDTKKLRQKILDLAIRGKLVPQDPNDEPASMLLERIRAEKERLIAEGKIKRPKKSKSSSSESHYQNFTPPFEIPDSWEWVRLGEIAYVASGSTPSKESFTDSGIPYLKMYNLRDQKIDFDYHPQYISEEIHNGKLARSRAQSGDLIMNIVGPPLGKLAIIPESIQHCNFNQAAVMIRPYLEVAILNKYLFFYLSEMSEINSIVTKGTAGQTNISLSQSQNMRIPVPPLGEMERINYKTSILISLIEDIENYTCGLHNSIKSVKNKILELAMQGKLVPQDPTDEPAADMLLRINPKAKIITDNPHYPQLPDNWVLTTIDSVCRYGACETVSVFEIDDEDWILELEDMESYTGRLLQIKRKKDRAISGPRHSFKSGDILFSRLRTYLNKVLLSTKDGFCSTEMIPITPFKCVIPEYLYYWLRSSFFVEYTISCGYGVKMPRISTSDANKAIVPLPPLEEQKCIVEIIQKFQYCLDEISNSLS